jgi:lysophospholipase L1-like esterase
MATGSGGDGRGQWAATWCASIHGPYPAGNATAQPEMRFALPDPARGARDQSFRLIVRPDVWGRAARLRFSNVLGARPLHLDDVHIGLQLSSSALMPGTNRLVTFADRDHVEIPPGSDFVSDPVALDFIADPAEPLLVGRRLAISFHVAGESGPMTWHAKAMQTSYLTPPGTGSHAADEGEGAFVHPTASWFFLDALEMLMDEPTGVIVCFGDSITDGSGSTMNGDDRWPDVMARRLHALHGNRVAVVNAGIGGNQILAPIPYSPEAPTAGGPSALARMERDVARLSGVSTVIWLEGINDLGHAAATAESVIAGLQEGVARLRRLIPGVRVVLGTITTALGATTGGHGTPEVDAHRRQINDFIRDTPQIDGFIDFDAAIRDPSSGRMRAEMVPGSSIGGPGDGLHPNRIGYQAMAAMIDPAMVVVRA